MSTRNEQKEQRRQLIISKALELFVKKLFRYKNQRYSQSFRYERRIDIPLFLIKRTLPMAPSPSVS